VVAMDQRAVGTVVVGETGIEHGLRAQRGQQVVQLDAPKVDGAGQAGDAGRAVYQAQVVRLAPFRLERNTGYGSARIERIDRRIRVATPIHRHVLAGTLVLRQLRSRESDTGIGDARVADHVAVILLVQVGRPEDLGHRAAYQHVADRPPLDRNLSVGRPARAVVVGSADAQVEV